MTLSVTCIDTLNYDGSIHAIQRTIETLGDKIDKIYWYSDRQIDKIYDREVVWIPIEKMNGQNDYTNVTLKRCPEICECDYDLIVQWDGYACNPEAWTDDFFNYDYIGATWDDGVVGNGGFSLRSKKLYHILKILKVKYLYSDFPAQVVDRPSYYSTTDNGQRFVPEDVVICRIYKEDLEQFDIRFAPFEIADRFSIENHSAISPWLNAPNPWIGKSLGFHGKYGIRALYS